ncbi:MAG: hypothetical protein O7C63_07220 [Alphaproteobacteria bacterium]|nr:hypothetical protein [Alphaproteobacteria bacterium]
MDKFLRNIVAPLLVTFAVLVIFVSAITFFSGVFDWVVYYLMDMG